MLCNFPKPRKATVMYGLPLPLLLKARPPFTAFATQDQTALTLSKLFVEKIVSHYGVPNQLLSDRGPSILLKHFLGVSSLMGTKKINTTVYHHQTDGLVEYFDRTLVDMLRKQVMNGTHEWDDLFVCILCI